MHGGIYPQVKDNPRDEKLKWYACQLHMAIHYYYPAENLYLRDSLLKIAAYALDKVKARWRQLSCMHIVCVLYPY